MKDTIYNASDLQPVKTGDNQRLYRDVVSGIGNIRSGDNLYYVKRRFLKGYEVEIASYHILEDVGLDVPECRYLPEYGITFTDVEDGSYNLEELYSRNDGLFEDLGMEGLRRSVSSKILLGDHDIEKRNFIIYSEDGSISPVDFELSGGTGKEKRMELKTRNIIEDTGAEFTYEGVLEEAE